MKRDLSYTDELVVARVHAEMINAGIIPTFNDLTTIEEYSKTVSSAELKRRKRKFRKIKKKILGKKSAVRYNPNGKTMVENYFLEKAINEFHANKIGVSK